VTAIDEIRRQLRKHGGIVSLPAGDLRRLVGAGRLGCHVRDDIVRLLDAESISIWPLPMPNDQRQAVMLTDRTSMAGRLIALALEAAKKDAVE
jgi:hypothetical protein